MPLTFSKNVILGVPGEVTCDPYTTWALLSDKLLVEANDTYFRLGPRRGKGHFTLEDGSPTQHFEGQLHHPDEIIDY